MLFKHVGVHM